MIKPHVRDSDGERTVDVGSVTVGDILTEPDDCSHCDPHHGSPNRCSWGVQVAPDRDADGQPVRLWVQPSNGAHVAQADADWLWRLIADAGRTDCHEPECDEQDLSGYVVIGSDDFVRGGGYFEIYDIDEARLRAAELQAAADEAGDGVAYRVYGLISSEERLLWCILGQFEIINAISVVNLECTRPGCGWTDSRTTWSPIRLIGATTAHYAKHHSGAALRVPRSGSETLGVDPSTPDGGSGLSGSYGALAGHPGVESDPPGTREAGDG